MPTPAEFPKVPPLAISDPFSNPSKSELLGYHFRREFIVNFSQPLAIVAATIFSGLPVMALLATAVDNSSLITAAGVLPVVATTMFILWKLMPWLDSLMDCYDDEAPHMLHIRKPTTAIKVIANSLAKLPFEERQAYRGLWREALQINESLASQGAHEELHQRLNKMAIVMASVADKHTEAKKVLEARKQEQPTQDELLEQLKASPELELARFHTDQLYGS